MPAPLPPLSLLRAEKCVSNFSHSIDKRNFGLCSLFLTMASSVAFFCCCILTYWLVVDAIFRALFHHPFHFVSLFALQRTQPRMLLVSRCQNLFI